MKRSLIFSAIAIGAYYLIRQFMSKEQAETITSAPRKKHITNAFSMAKERAVAVTE